MGRKLNAFSFRAACGVLASSVPMLLASCSSGDVVCGSVEPKNPTEIESRILEIATRESLSFCSVDGAACEIAAYETRGGRTVRVSRVFAQDGKCIGALGDERYFGFDGTGRLVRTLNGI